MIFETGVPVIRPQKYTHQFKNAALVLQKSFLILKQLLTLLQMQKLLFY